MRPGTTIASDSRDPYLPSPYVIASIERETPSVWTFMLEPVAAAPGYRAAFEPGQFNMLLLPGAGEVAISISSDPDGSEGLRHTIRAVGRVTNAVCALEPGRQLGVRGPYGSSWPVERGEGRDVLVVAGGLGLAPLRPAIRRLVALRSRFRRVILIHGARTPEDLLYPGEYDDWTKAGLELHITVDHAGPAWRGSVGVVPAQLRGLALDPAATLALVCGPEIMMRYTIRELLADGVHGDDIALSLERNMQCAIGLCGHCQLGPEFLCLDGPVFAYPRVAWMLGVNHF